MIELKLFENLKARERFHSAILTSYSFDMHHFERQVLRVLKTKGISNVSVFVDANRLDDCLGTSTGYINNISSRYGLAPISVTGAFHPKLSFFVGEEHVALLFGSGNITVSGHGQNHELFDLLYADKDNRSQLPLIHEAWGYLQDICKRSDSEVTEQLNWADHESEMIQAFEGPRHQWTDMDKGLRAALLYPDAESDIHQQLSSLIPMEEIQKVTVLSPYFDERGKVLQQMAEQMTNATFEVFLQSGFGIHPYGMPPTERVKFYDWQGTDRAQRMIKGFDRLLHAKVVVFSTAKGQYCMFGSANLSHQAIGIEGLKAVNEEFSILLFSPDVDYIMLLGLGGKRRPMTLDWRTGKLTRVFDHIEGQSLGIRLTQADLKDRTLHLSWRGKMKTKTYTIGLFDFWGRMLLDENQEGNKDNGTQLKIPAAIDLQSLAYVHLFSVDFQCDSNKHPIIDIGALYNNHPSKENRDYIKLLHKIETGTDGMMDVVEYFGHLWRDRVEEKDRVMNESRSQSIVQVKDEEEGISYAEALRRKELKETHGLSHSSGKEERFWEAIETDMARRAAELEEDLAGEEDGDDDAGKERERREASEKSPVVLNSRKVLAKERRRIDRFVRNYDKVLLDLTDNDPGPIVMRELALGLIFTDRILRLIRTKIVFKQEEGEVFLLQVKGHYSALDSCTGITLNTISVLVERLCEAEWEVPKDHVLKDRQERYQNSLVARILLVLAHCVCEYPEEIKRLSAWMELLYRDLHQRFYLQAKDFESVRSYALRYLGHEHDHNRELKVLERWRKQADETRADIRLIEGIGHCRVVKEITSSGNREFLKLERPGFPYRFDEHDFVRDELYDIQTGGWMRTKQSMKR